MKKKDSAISRRQFLLKSAAGFAGSVIAGKAIGQATESAIADIVDPKSKVVLVRHPKAITASGQVEAAIVEEMITEAITTFTGNESVKDAWSTFVTPEDIVGLKVCTLGLMSLAGTELISHYNVVTTAIQKGLNLAEVQDKNIIIWDRSDEELENAGFSITNEPEKLKVFGTVVNRSQESIGYDNKEYPVGSLKSRVTKILTDLTTAMINIPVMKTHGIAGITGALKSHYGTVDNPNALHDNYCTNPGVPEVNAIPIIREKQKLIIVDALLGVFEGGPWWKQNFIWPYGGIMIGTDPVAIDAVMLSIIEEKRKQLDMSSVKHMAKFLPLSENLGLGSSKLDDINLVQIELG